MSLSDEMFVKEAIEKALKDNPDAGFGTMEMVVKVAYGKVEIEDMSHYESSRY